MQVILSNTSKRLCIGNNVFIEVEWLDQWEDRTAEAKIKTLHV